MQYPVQRNNFELLDEMHLLIIKRCGFLNFARLVKLFILISSSKEAFIATTYSCMKRYINRKGKLIHFLACHAAMKLKVTLDKVLNRQCEKL